MTTVVMGPRFREDDIEYAETARVKPGNDDGKPHTKSIEPRITGTQRPPM
jgi:hypothetical protein